MTAPHHRHRLGSTALGAAHHPRPPLLRRRPPWRRRSGTVTVPPADEDEQRQWVAELAALLCAVGAEMLRAGMRTTDVEDRIREIAVRYGVRARSFIVPTGLFVRAGGGPDGTGGELDFAPVSGPTMRLDQVQAVDALVERMRMSALPFAEVRAELERERELPVRFSPLTTVAGHTLLTVGLGALLHTSPSALAGYAVLGVLVGLLRLAARRFPVLRTALPVVAAVLVTALALRWAGPLLGEPAARMFVPPLISFLPGAALTMGAVELATGAVLSGVARLAGALNVLLLLAFGILAGTELVPVHPIDGPVPDAFGSWASWCGVLLLGLGFILHHSAPRGALPWLLVALFVERGVQVVGSLAYSTSLGIFAAGALLPVLASWAGRRSAVPEQVVFLPCFWMLVPGSTGLKGFSDLLVNHDPNSLWVLVNTVVTVVAIALGVLVGAGFLQRTRLELASPSPVPGPGSRTGPGAGPAPEQTPGPGPGPSGDSAAEPPAEPAPDSPPAPEPDPAPEPPASGADDRHGTDDRHGEHPGAQEERDDPQEPGEPGERRERDE
ncbi:MULTISPECIES: threonine/serine ThrE exporter family protein [unclassified Streptomyces]|uniref:threonine/serine ThrE exporter family protein n=1 Tax=unclassified Streptomyces TaxID=2593676 RepID=UPI00068B87B2|nr:MULTISPECIES: threonine/serine exporter family protein [unclassified Streptomyces]QHF98041.1 hypothetical protein DEH18_34140 [Streptomyces sp. NHF165]